MPSGSSVIVRFFVTAVLGLIQVICVEHVFSALELASRTYSNSKNNVYSAIREKVFDLTHSLFRCAIPFIDLHFFHILGRSAHFAKVFLDGQSVNPT